MKTKIIKNANYVGWIVIVLAFVFIYFSYFFVYIPKQKSDLTQRGFRILKEYGNNMVGKYDYYETHFKNYGIFYSLKYFQDSLSIPVPNSENADYNKIKSVVQNLFPYVSTHIVQKSADTAFFYSKKENILLLNFYYQTPDSVSFGKITDIYKITGQINNRQKSLKTLLRERVINQVPIENFMEGLKFDDLFENIILFDESMVYYNSNLENLIDLTNPGLLNDTTKKAQGGIYITLNINGNDKHFMIIPIDFDGKRFYIAGSILDTNFKSITHTFNSRIMLLVACILLLIFVGMPLLKTIFIGPKERLNSIDVAASVVSILFGSALFVLFNISLFKNQFVDQSELSNRIKKISDVLYSNVTQDINSIKTLGNSIALGESSPNDSLAKLVIENFNSKDTSFFQLNTLNSPFPLNEIILIDSLGFVKKAVTRTPFSDAVAVNVGKRSYFKNVANINKSWPTLKNSHFFLESIQSYNTGTFETAISFPTSKYKNCKVLAITSEIPSLYKQVLPKDIEFVVIDNIGKVLYHSKKAKNLHENFIEECESDPGILNAIKLRVKDDFQIKYNEEKWLARIAPIEDTPLYHITLLDLNQTDNKNARIFLITFFFMIGLQFVTIGGYFMLRITFHPNKNDPKVYRHFNWRAYQPAKYKSYKGLLVILLLIATAGISSFLMNANLVNVIMLQVLNVGFTFFSSLLFLKRDEITYQNYFRGKYSPEILIFACLVILIILCFWQLGSDISLAIPLIILLFTTLIIPWVFRYFNNDRRNQDTSVSSMKKIRLTYLAVMFMWLTIFSVIPVIHSYFSVRHFEEKLWKQQQLFKVAGDNLLLMKLEKDYNSEWFKPAKGNGIDNIKVDYVLSGEKPDQELLKADTVLTTSERIYASLPDPITNGYSHRELLAGKEQKTEWNLTSDTLYFPGSDKKGYIRIEAGKKPTTAKGHLFLMSFVFLLAAICILQLVKFAATVFLNLYHETPKLSNIKWLTFLNNEDTKRILLKTFNGGLFLTETINSIKNNEHDAKIFESIHALKFCDSEFECESYLKNSGKIIWIYGLTECIPEIAKHNLLLDSLKSLNHDHSKKIVVDSPFDLEIIDEFYDDYISSNELSSKELTDIYILRKRWKIIFDDYSTYDGFLYQFETDEPEIKLHEEYIREYRQNINREWCYSNIWRNLTNYEKIVLYDLADDGLMNRNNRSIIRQLTEKKLILIKPFPVLFTPDFNDFIYKNISKSEIKEIEEKLGLKGGWKNAKYLILLILIPLAAFIFISQGITVEKSFGIFAGLVGAITTLMKLFENTSVKAK